MRVAFVGKGGSGKSVIAGTLARMLARQGKRVLAVDSDPMPGLSLSLGIGVVETAIPDEAVEERPEHESGPRYRLRTGLSAAEAVDSYALIAPDGVRLLQFGKARGHLSSLVRSQFAFRQILRDLPADQWNLIGDLPGGTRQPFFGWAGYADTVVVVVEPTVKSLLSARRLAGLALAETGPERILAVANKVRDPADAEFVRRRGGLEVLAAIPWDPALREAESEGKAPTDSAPHCPAVQVIALMARQLSKGHDQQSVIR